MRNYVTELRYEIITRNQKDQEVKIGVYIVENTLLWVFQQFHSTEITRKLRYVLIPKIAITRNT